MNVFAVAGIISISSQAVRHIPKRWFGYDQDQKDWVLVLKGAACRVFEDGREVSIGPGDLFALGGAGIS